MVGKHRCDTGVQVYLKQDGLSALGSWTDLSVHSAAGIDTMVADYRPTAMVIAFTRSDPNRRLVWLLYLFASSCRHHPLRRDSPIYRVSFFA